MRALVSVGCSFAYGQGLSDPTKTYAHLLADKYGRTLFDYSRAGCSNEYIASSCAAAIKTAMMHCKPEDIVVLVGWTDQARMTVFDNEHGDIMSAFPHLNRKVTTIDGFVGKHAWHDSFGLYKLYHAYHYVNMLCRAYGIQCIHVANISAIFAPFPSSTWKSHMAKVDTRTLFDIFDHNDRTEIQKLFSYKDSFLGLIESNKKRFTIGLDDIHPNEEAHRCWTEKIIERYDHILGCQLRTP
jgi:hypothetical protein